MSDCARKDAALNAAGRWIADGCRGDEEPILHTIDAALAPVAVRNDSVSAESGQAIIPDAKCQNPNCARERAAHEETRRRLEEAEREIERLQLSMECDQRDPEHQNCRNGEQQLLAQLKHENAAAQAAEAALEQARRELAEARESRDANRRRITGFEIVLQQLSSLLSCEPGQVVERVKEIMEALEWVGPGDRFVFPLGKTIAAILAPSRPASEPARTICDKHHTGGGTYYVDECPQCAPAPPASVAEQAQLRTRPCYRAIPCSKYCPKDCSCSCHEPDPPPQTGEGR